jgi:hypothetical protein
MQTQLTAPSFPFSSEDVLHARDFRSTLDGLKGIYGPAIKDWDELGDANFCKVLAVNWAFLFGKAPTSTETPAKMLSDQLAVTEEQFLARIQTGAVPS